MSERSGRRDSRMIHLALAVSAAVMVMPFVWQILSSLKSNREVSRLPPTFFPEQLTLSGYTTFFNTVPVGRMFVVSVVALLIRVVGHLAIAAMAGYAFARLDFPGRKVLFAIFIAMLMAPSQLFIIGQFGVVKSLGLLDTIPAFALPGIFSAFGTFLFRQAFAAVPQEYEDAARIDGANVFQIFSRIYLPIVAPTAAALAVLTALFSWNDLLWPLIVTSNERTMPLPVGLAGLQGQYGTDYPTLMAGALVCSLPLVLAFLVMQRQFFTGVAASGLKG